MAYYGDCISCQYGDHDGHVDVPGPVAEGVIGGWVCPCKGDCGERNPKPHFNATKVELPQMPDGWPFT